MRLYSASFRPARAKLSSCTSDLEKKVAGRVGQVTDNIVYLSHLTGAEFLDAFVDVKDISAVVIRAAGR
jgi:hypothetical protein